MIQYRSMRSCLLVCTMVIYLLLLIVEVVVIAVVLVRNVIPGFARSADRGMITDGERLL